MIRLHPDFLVFKLSNGDQIPCSAESITIELMGDSVDQLDPAIIKNAAAAVLHYFRDELEREAVSVGEFSEALEKILRGFGFSVTSSSDPETPATRVVESDLCRLASQSGKGFELLFFPRLRQELHDQLSSSPEVLRFSGLRGCVKQLTGAKRWTNRCQRLNDQIVEFLRICLCEEHSRPACALVVW